MSLAPRTRLGAYEIHASIGAGGMGEVYRARDTRLDRDVAIKVLPDSFASDADFRTRFQREARAVAALSHPNIVQIYELGSDGPHLFAAMELLDGTSLRERLQAGALPARKVAGYALQIASGLAAAHVRGIVHRDLKPENIFVTADGRVKILDFGLAKVALPPEATDATGAGATVTVPGIVLGTVGYMAPEQVRAQPVDHRADIFAFGAVLFEMATGRRAFAAGSSIETMHAVLNSDPLEGESLATLPPALEPIVRHCLEKNPDERFQSARDLAFALQTLSHAPDTRLRPLKGAGLLRRNWRLAAAALFLVAASAATAWMLAPGAPASTQAVAFNILLPADARIHWPTVSPDGTRIAFSAQRGHAQGGWADLWSTGDAIWVRRIDSTEPEEIKGTGGVRGLFWSPDGGSIGFFSGGKLKTIEIATGRTQVVCDAPGAYGGSWGTDGTILFSADANGPIRRVSASGGIPAPVSTVDASRGDEGHRWPQWLGDGRHFLYMPWSSASTQRRITVASLDGSPPRELFTAASGALFAGDYLVYAVDQPARLMAQPFDQVKLEVHGEPFPAVADTNVEYDWVDGNPRASVSTNGTLAYTTGKYRRMQLTWFSRTGAELAKLGEPGAYFDPVISPDGSTVALEKHDFDRGSGDVWTVDLARGTMSRVSSAPGFENLPVWSPDGRRIAYVSDDGTPALRVTATASGVSKEEVLLPGRVWATDWSPDGRHIVFMGGGNAGAPRGDVHTLDLETGTVSPIIATPFMEGWATFSPDGKWIAYVSDESQRPQVYVRSFPDGAVKTQISTAGGSQAQWRRDGRELFYLSPDNVIMSVDVESSGRHFKAGAPRQLFLAHVEQSKVIRNNYAVSSDGQRFLVLSLVDRHASHLVSVLNWKALAQRR